MSFLERLNQLLERPLGRLSRWLLIGAALLLVPTYIFPLWKLTMFAPQYPDGLTLDIFTYTLGGGNGGQDIDEINILNHYIGMRDLTAEDFNEFKWMPFVIGGLALLSLRAAVFAKVAQVVDLIALFGYFSAFSGWSFAYKLYRYGHTLAPGAPVKVDPFMPPLFGHAKLANFDVYSYPGLGTYALVAAGMAVVAALIVAIMQSRSSAAPA